mmetsp:Transcript_10065/g.26078  ORF Transcript_10065/g.26078 Transcript_10065/m.26078 type:complete len:229 (-) Transcript_10065:77-763(-)
MPASASTMLHYGSVHRGNTLLCEAYGNANVSVVQVQKLVAKSCARKTTPGWDSISDRSSQLKLTALPIHLSDSVITVLGVASSDFPSHLLKGFVEKIALLVRPLVDDPLVDTRTHLALQANFGATLEQRLDQSNAVGKLALVTEKVDEVKEIMHDNIESMLAQQNRVSDLEDKAAEMSLAAREFKKQTTRAKRFHYWNQAKMGVVVGTAATAVTAAVVTPIVIGAMAV